MKLPPKIKMILGEYLAGWICYLPKRDIQGLETHHITLLLRKNPRTSTMSTSANSKRRSNLVAAGAVISNRTPTKVTVSSLMIRGLSSNNHSSHSSNLTIPGMPRHISHSNRMFLPSNLMTLGQSSSKLMLLRNLKLSKLLLCTRKILTKISSSRCISSISSSSISSSSFSSIMLLSSSNMDLATTIRAFLPHRSLSSSNTALVTMTKAFLLHRLLNSSNTDLATITKAFRHRSSISSPHQSRTHTS